MSRATLGTLLLILGIADATVGRQEMPDWQSCGESLPKETILLLHVANGREFCKSLAATEIMSVATATPANQMLEFALRELQQDAAISGGETWLGDDQFFTDLLVNMSKGPIQFAIAKADTGFVWRISIGCDWQHPFLQKIIEGFKKDNRWGILTVQPVKDGDSGDSQPDPGGSRGFRFHFRFGQGRYLARVFEGDESRLELFNDMESAKWWDAKATEKSHLDTSRKFMAIGSTCKLDQQGDRELWFFADLDAWIRIIAGESERDGDFQVKGMDELLATGGRLVFGEADSKFDWYADVYLKQAVPRSGVNNLVRFGKWETVCGKDVPAEVDFYFAAQLDLRRTWEGVRDLENAWKVDQPNGNIWLTNLIGDVSPLIGYLLRPDGGQPDFDCFEGLYEHFGYSYHNPAIAFSDSVTRLRHSADSRKSSARWLPHVKAFSELAEKQFRDVRYLTEPDEWAQQREQSYRDRGIVSGTPKSDSLRVPTWEPIAFTSWENFSWMFSRRSDFERLVIEQQTETESSKLDQDEDFNRVLKWLNRLDRPDAIYFSRRGFWYGRIFRQLRLIHLGNTDWAGERLRQGGLTPSETRIREETVRTFKDWNLKPPANRLGSGGVGIFEQPSGIRVRMIQFRKSR